MLVLLGHPRATNAPSGGLGFVEAVAAAVRAAKPQHALVVLDLDGPFSGEPLTVGADAGSGVSVKWSGHELTRAAAIWVERPVFSWPQPIGGAGRREIAALRLSALAILAERVPTANPPACAELALAPVLALERLEARGIAVHGWHYGARVDDGLAWRDGIGRVLDYEPAEPALGDLAWRPEALGDEASGLETLLVVGDRVVGAERSASLQAWTHTWSAPERSLADARVDDATAALALRATQELELVFAAVTLARERGDLRVVDVDVAPDLGRWNRSLGGAAAEACARWLIATAAKEPVR